MSKTDRIAAGLGLFLAAVIASPAAAASPGAPDIAACSPYRPEEGEMELQRTAPLPIPRALRGVASANIDYIAVATLQGATLCIFSREMESIELPTLTADGRFFGFEWSGYEAGGYVLVDRAGRGAEVETGARPVPSPGGTRLASVEWSASGFGSLNGVLVLGTGPASVMELARLEDLPEGDDWRIDRWVGENCFEISSLPWNGEGTDASAAPKPPRRRQTVQASEQGWAIGLPGSACPPA